MRDEAVKHFGLSPHRISVIPYGIDERFLTTATDDHLATTRRKYGIDGPYILAVGDIHPRKNLGRLFEAFSIMSHRDGLKLVLVGKPLWKTSELFDSIKRSGLEDCVVATGYVDAADLPPLYQAANVFCYPSLYEGFGFPIIEGMASGVPVAASRASSCPDVGGDAVAYFDPTSVEDIAGTLDRLVSDDELRNRLVLAGWKRVREFSWEKTARQTMDVYRSLA